MRKSPRARKDDQGLVIWITGLSGAGKSSIARDLVRRLKSAGDAGVVLLDGDQVRGAVGDPGIGHDRASRLTNALRICRFAKLLADQDLKVVVATMSLFKEIHAWNRLHLHDYFEVYVKVELDVLKARDARGLYSHAARGDVGDVVGIHVPYDEPESPDLIVDNGEMVVTFDALAQQIQEALRARAPKPASNV